MLESSKMFYNLNCMLCYNHSPLITDYCFMDPLTVYKKLPRKNCGKCSAGTCMAFAVQFLRRMIPLTECNELDDASRKGIDALLSDTGDWKERRLKELFDEIRLMDMSGRAEDLGAQFKDGFLTLRYLGKDIHLDNNAFHEGLDIWDKLLLLMYVKQSGRGPLGGKWVAFRDLKDGMIRSGAFHDECEIPIARMMESDSISLLHKLDSMGADRVDGFSTESAYALNVLPRIPFLILLWPGEEDFAADCKMLLDSASTAFLDIEALLYLGIALVRALQD
jgi:hypothetical protein